MNPGNINYQPLEDMKHARSQVMRTALRGMAWPITGVIVAVGLFAFIKTGVPHPLIFMLIFYFAYIQKLVSNYKNEVWERFAAANNWPIDTDTPTDSLIPPSLQFGHDQHYSPAVQATVNGVVCDILSYNTTTGSGKSQETHFFTVALSRLPQAVPHMVLRAKHSANDMQQDFGDMEKLKLEGDFDDHFSLQIEKGTEVDALTILTPDVMQSLVNYDQHEDIEFVGASLYFIIWGDARDPAAMQQLVRSVSELTGQLSENARLAGRQAPGAEATASVAAESDNLLSSLRAARSLQAPNRQEAYVIAIVVVVMFTVFVWAFIAAHSVSQ